MYSVLGTSRACQLCLSVLSAGWSPATWRDGSRVRHSGHCVCCLLGVYNTFIAIALQLQMPAYSRLQEMGCSSVLANHWRCMRHRLRRRLGRQGMAAKHARGARTPRTGNERGLEQSHSTNGLYGSRSLVNTGTEGAQEDATTQNTTGNHGHAGGNEGGKNRDSDGAPFAAEGDLASVGDGGERSPKRARTQEETINEQVASN